MKVCRLNELLLTARKDGTDLLSKWLGLIAVNLLGFIASEANAENEGK